MDLFKDLEDIILDEIEYLEKHTNISLNIDYTNLKDLLKQYYTIIYKLIFPLKPRTVSYSQELEEKIRNNSIPQNKLDSLEEVKEKFENGEDVNSYLSRGSLESKVEDGLLIDWRVHHLHLSLNKVSGDYFYKRSDWLLLFYYDPDQVCFIDVSKHLKGTEWAYDDILSIFEKNWPEILEEHQMKFFNKAEALSPSDRYSFRKNGVYSFVEINGKVFTPPGGGFNSDGSSIAVMQNVSMILKTIEDFNNKFENNPDNIRQLFKDNGYTLPQIINFKLVLNSNYIGVLETETNVFYSLGIYNPKLDSFI
jgi:hypothetical protein